MQDIPPIIQLNLLGNDLMPEIVSEEVLTAAAHLLNLFEQIDLTHRQEKL